MLKRQQRLLVSAIFFIAVVLILTRVDYLIHSDLYNNGLQWSEDWFWNSQILYFLMYQVVIIALFLYSRSYRLLMVLEGFVCTGGQDLVFFGLWGAAAFPTSTWTWNLLYMAFGLNWTTTFQVYLTSVVTGAMLFLAWYLNPDRWRNYSF
jgi:hypothetical protein